MPELLNTEETHDGKNANHHGLNLESAVAIAGGVSVLYLMSILFELPLPWVFGLCFSSMVAIVWMAVRILKDPFSTEKTFDESFYQDRDDMRRTRVE